MTKTTIEYFCDHCGTKVDVNQSVYFETWSGTDAAGSRDEDGPSLHLCTNALILLVRELLATSRLTTSAEGIPKPFTDSERAALAKWITRKAPHTVDLRERGEGWLQREPSGTGSPDTASGSGSGDG